VQARSDAREGQYPQTMSHPDTFGAGGDIEEFAEFNAVHSFKVSAFRRSRKDVGNHVCD
jgi:hypothetical protein